MIRFKMEEITEATINWIKEWFEKESGNAKGVIVGISGGKDSTVVANLCVKALGKDRVYGVLMPQGEQKDIDDAIEVCESLKINYQIVNIENIVYELENRIRYSKNFKYKNYGTNQRIKTFDNFHPLCKQSLINIPPRIRMTVLYAIGQDMGYRVVGTGNASESAVGYTTKWGDNANDFNPIAVYTTEELIKMGEILNIPDHLIHKVPFDGLCGKTDEENLGISYKDINDYITLGHCENKEIEERIKEKKINSLHKRIPIPCFLPSRKFLKDSEE